MDMYETLKAIKLVGGAGGAGTRDYENLENLPSINGKTVIGQLLSSDLGLADKLTEEQIEAINSGITQAILESIESEQESQGEAIAHKQDTLSTEQLSAINSGIDSTKVAQIAMNENNISKDESALVELVDGGAKNLLKITASSQTIKGVTFTVNDDQTVTVNGTNNGTGPAIFIIVPNAQAATIPDGKYILSGCPAGGGTPSYDLRWWLYSPGKSAYDFGAGSLVEKSGNTTDSNIAIVVKEGQTANNLVFNPMICSKADWDISQSYQPYAPSNAELYAMIQALQTQLSNQ